MQIEFKNIHKSFGQVHANDNIDFTIPSGVIQGLLGENGAGKSTLMKILSGFIHPDQGQLLLSGKVVRINSPADAIRHGIGMLHQDPLDFPPMRVIDNFIIGHPGKLFPNRKSITQTFTELQQQFGFSLDPEAYVDTLTVGERQQLEILRLLWLGANAFILDEPTTGISALQKEKLFAALKRLAEQGKTIIFVSHKLEDVEALCHRVAVLRRGKLVGQAESPYQTERLVELMFGRVVSLDQRQETVLHHPILKLDRVTVENYRLRVGEINLEVRGGEVIGLAGMEGSGQELFLRACAGLIPLVGGQVFVGGRELTNKSYRNFLRQGVGYLPAARLEEGLISGLSLTEHFVLSQDQQGLFIAWEQVTTVTEKRISEYNIRGAPVTPVEALSGGNQQRALAAMLKTPLSLLLLEHPTRGLDIESAIWIWGKFKKRAQQEGSAILFMSSDLEEILHYSDRILVFFGGRVSQPLAVVGTSVDQLGQLIGGVGW